jgi:large subunit ribosomal protein L9
MQVILLERIANLGQMGDEVRVRDGYARNFLLPQGKALRANEGNRKQFEAQRAQLEARNLERKNEADAVATKLNEQTFIIIRQAAETGQLYGSVTTRDLAEVMTENGFSVGRAQVVLQHPIKTIGVHAVQVHLHADVDATIKANVARSADEAERQARGEDLTRPIDEREAEEAEAAEAEAEEGEVEESDADASAEIEAGDATEQAADTEEEPAA